jgi:putative hydrolases of HD superfamily
MEKSWLPFLHACENLKKERRTAFLSDGRQEDDADHSWRVAVMALVLCPSGLDKDKCVKMALIHDLSEAFCGDFDRFDKGARGSKKQMEAASMRKLLSLVPDRKVSKELGLLWKEADEKRTPEARFVKTLDKLEVLIQYDEAPLRKWPRREKEMHYGLAGLHSENLGFLRTLAGEIDKETGKKLGKGARRMTREEYSEYFGDLAKKGKRSSNSR